MFAVCSITAGYSCQLGFSMQNSLQWDDRPCVWALLECNGNGADDACGEVSCRLTRLRNGDVIGSAKVHPPALMDQTHPRSDIT